MVLPFPALLARFSAVLVLTLTLMVAFFATLSTVFTVIVIGLPFPVDFKPFKTSVEPLMLADTFEFPPEQVTLFSDAFDGDTVTLIFSDCPSVSVIEVLDNLIEVT